MNKSYADLSAIPVTDRSGTRLFGWLSGTVILGALTLGIWWANQDWPEDAPAIRIGYQQSPPYQEIGPNGELGGVGLSLVIEAAKRLGIKLEWVYSPQSPDAHFAQGDVDMWPIVTDLPHRRENFHITKPIYENSLGILHLEGSEIETPTDTAGKKVAYWNREPGITLVEELFPDAQLVPLTSHVAAIDAVFLGECEAAFLWSTKRNAIDFKRAIDEHQKSGYHFYYFPDRKITCGVAARFENPMAVRAANLIRDEIGRLALNGKAQEIYFKYYLDPENEISSYFYGYNLNQKNYWLAAAIVFLILLAGVLAYTAIRLRRSQMEARAAIKAKSEFLANMSHEVRTPLNGIMGMTQLAMRSYGENEQRNMLQIVMQSADALLMIVNDILELSKIESDKLSIEPSPVKLRELLDTTMPFFEAMADQKGIAFSLHISTQCPNVILGDSLRLRQIIFNLVGNALKFTSKGSISVRLSILTMDDGPHLLFEVEDTGIGIPEKKLDFIFDAFTQADSSITRKFGGTGLGLTISQNLVKLMGGDIQVESVENRGSVFSFNIPLLTPDDTEPQDESKKEASLAHSLNILVVEDNEINIKTIQLILNRLGHKVTVARHGGEAIEILDDSSFDLIFMDIHMPVLNGWETTRAIRKKEYGSPSRTPIVALTAIDLNEEKRQVIKSEMDGYLAKPLRMSELQKELNRFSSVGYKN